MRRASSAAWRGRGLIACGLLAAALATAPARAATEAADLPRDPDALVDTIREAIEARDFERFEELVNWQDAGKIKRRIVAFQIRHGLGRPVAAISFEPFPADGLAAHEASGKLTANMPLTHRVRVVYDEPPVEGSSRPPTSVFLVGKHDGAYRIGLVVRRPDFDDDDD